MVFGWMTGRRRRRLLAEPFPAERRETLRRRVRHFQYLPAAQQERVRETVQVMLGEKDWAAAAGFEVTDEMRVTVAGFAAVMVSAQEKPYYYDRLSTIIIHADTINLSERQTLLNPNLPNLGPLDGVAWQRGPVMISWAAMRDDRRARRFGRNVVIHEFAHHLDGLNGEMDGLPPLPRATEQRWAEMAEQERAMLARDLRSGTPTLLDDSGVGSAAEFFAVASERFFELPHEMRRRHREIYNALAEFYRQDPTEWLPR